MNPTQSSAAAAGGMTGAAMVVMTWALSLIHVTVPAEVALAAMTLVAPLVHVAALFLTRETAALTEPKPNA